MTLRSAKFEIFRADPGSGSVQRYDTFEVEYSDRTTVLDLLREIRSYQDGSLAFRMSCRSGICGSCGMRINGYAKLACQTRVADVVRGGTTVIEPLGIYPVIKDLVVDLEPFWYQNKLIKPWLEPKTEMPTHFEREQLMTAEQVSKMKRLADCILCACCTSSCNSHEVEPRFQGPQALSKSCRFALDPRDKLGARRGSAETAPRGVYWCCYCNFCTEVCPKDVRPAESITTLKGLAFSEGIPNEPGARRSLAFYDTVRLYGRINEGTLPLRSKRLGVVGYIPLGVRLLAKGKLPTPVMRPIPRAWELTKIYRNREVLPGQTYTVQIEKRLREEAAGPVEVSEDYKEEAIGSARPAGSGPMTRTHEAEAGPSKRVRTPLRYAYYPGCTAETICKELDISTRAVSRKLGIDLVDFPWNCCGAGTSGEFGDDFLLAMHARVFALCEEKDADLVTVCNTCLMNLSKTNRAFKEDPALLERANAMLVGTGLAYRGTVDVKHFVWVLADEIGVTRLAAMVKRRLSGLRVGPFYGCHILRPSYALGWEDAEEPRSLHGIIQALGAQAVTYDGHNRCCGFHILLANQGAANAMAARRFDRASDEGVDLLVTPCPLCNVALDVYQQPIERLAGKEYDLPVLHVTQLLGLGLGLEPREVGLEKHLVDTRPVLDKLGLSL